MAIEWKKTAYIGLKQLSDESFFIYVHSRDQKFRGISIVFFSNNQFPQNLQRKVRRICFLSSR